MYKNTWLIFAVAALISVGVAVVDGMAKPRPIYLFVI
jgi:hypothetical protein